MSGKKDRKVIIKSYHYKRSIVLSLRKTKESIKRKGRLTKENRDNLQDMIDP